MAQESVDYFLIAADADTCTGYLGCSTTEV